MMTERFRYNLPVTKVDREHGVVFGFATVSKEDGKEYWDTQGDYLTESATVRACLRFADSARVGKENHAGEAIGDVPCIFPLTEDIAKANGIQTERHGTLIGFRINDQDVLEKFEQGEYSGFSIGGELLDYEVMDEVEKDDDRFEKRYTDGKKKRRRKNPRTRKVNDYLMREISIVPRPAQEPATIGIAKSDELIPFLKADYEPDILGEYELTIEDMEKQEFSAEQRRDLAEAGAAMSDGSFPIRNRADLRNAIQAFGRASNKAATARHIRSRARALGLTSLLPDEGRLAELIGKGQTMPNDNTDTNSPSAAEFADMKKSLGLLTTQLETANAVISLSADQAAFYKGLSTDDAATFLKKDADGRAADVAKAASADPVVATVDGVEFRKSDDPRLVQMAKQRAADKQELTELKKQREVALFEKQAADTLSAIPGELTMKARVLHHLSTCPDQEVVKAAGEMLAAGSKALEAAAVEKGYSVNPEGALENDSPEAAFKDTLFKALNAEYSNNQ